MPHFLRQSRKRIPQSPPMRAMDGSGMEVLAAVSLTALKFVDSKQKNAAMSERAFNRWVMNGRRLGTPGRS